MLVYQRVFCKNVGPQKEVESSAWPPLGKALKIIKWTSISIENFPIKNGDFPIKNGDFPIKNGDFPIKNGDFPIKNGDFPISYVSHYQRMNSDSRSPRTGTDLHADGEMRQGGWHQRERDRDPWLFRGGDWARESQSNLRSGKSGAASL